MNTWAQKFAKYKEHKHKDVKCSLQVLLDANANPIEYPYQHQKGYLQPHSDLLYSAPLCMCLHLHKH